MRPALLAWMALGAAGATVIPACLPCMCKTADDVAVWMPGVWDGEVSRTEEYQVIEELGPATVLLTHADVIVRWTDPDGREFGLHYLVTDDEPE